MNIAVSQYNAVIDGLRTQLELQRAMAEEKNEEIRALKHWLRTSREETQREAEAHRDNLATHALEWAKLREQREYCGAIASQGSTIQFCGKDWVHTSASAAVQELVDKFTTLEAKHDALLKKRRGK
jgi:hypothetical protein